MRIHTEELLQLRNIDDRLQLLMPQISGLVKGDELKSKDAIQFKMRLDGLRSAVERYAKLWRKWQQSAERGR